MVYVCDNYFIERACARTTCACTHGNSSRPQIVAAVRPQAFEGRGKEGLVHTACATFSVYFTVKVSVKVQVARVHTTEKVYRSSIRRATCLAALARAYRVDRTYATIVQRCNGYHKSECLSVLWQHSASQALCSSV